MKKLRKYKSFSMFVLGVVIGSLLFSGMPAFGDTLEYIFTKSDCKLVFDGQEYSNPDIKDVLFMYQERNYIPVAVFRDACLKAGIPFEYDDKTKEIRVTTEKQTAKSVTTPITSSISSDYKEYIEDKLQIVEVDNEKFIRLSSLDKKLIGTGYNIEFESATCFLEYLHKKISENIKIYGTGLRKIEQSKNFKDSDNYIYFNDYTSKILPLIKTEE